nr:sigmaC [Reptilian orthoreovirus]
MMSQALTDGQRKAVIKLCLAFAGGGAVGGDVEELTRRVGELETAVVGLRDEISVLDRDVASVTRRLQDVETETTALSNTLQIVQSHVEEIVTQVRKLMDQISALEVVVNKNTADIEGVRNTVTDLGSIVGAEKARLDGVVRDVSTQGLSITDLQTRVAKLEKEAEPTSFEWPLKKDGRSGQLSLNWDPWFLETTEIFGLSWAQSGIEIGAKVGQGDWYAQGGNRLYTVSLNFIFYRYRSMGAFSLSTGNALLSGAKVELRIPYDTSGTGLSGSDLQNMTPSPTSRFPLTFVTRITVGGGEYTMPITLTVRQIDGVSTIILTPADLPGTASYPCYLKGESIFYYIRARQMT